MRQRERRAKGWGAKMAPSRGASNRLRCRLMLVPELWIMVGTRQVAGGARAHGLDNGEQNRLKQPFRASFAQLLYITFH